MFHAFILGQAGLNQALSVTQSGTHLLQSGNIMESEDVVGTCKCEKRRMVYGLGIEGDLKILI